MRTPINRSLFLIHSVMFYFNFSFSLFNVKSKL